MPTTSIDHASARQVRNVLVGAVVFCCAGSLAHADDPCPPFWDTAIGIPGIRGDFGADTSYVWDMLTWDDGTGAALYVGGEFAKTGEIHAKSIARWDGTAWSNVGGGLDCHPCDDHEVHSMIIWDDGSGEALFAAGRFYTGGSNDDVQNVAKWDGVEWTQVGEGFNTPANDWAIHFTDMLIWDDGTGPALYVGSVYTKAGEQFIGGIARWDGVEWTDLDGGTNGSVFTIGVYDDGTGEALYAGGVFTSAGGVPAYNIAKWDGAAWSALPDVPEGLLDATSDRPYDMLVWDDGDGEKLYIAGHYFSTGGQARGLLSWDGTDWNYFVGAGPTAYSLTVWDDGTGESLYVGGFGVKRLDGSTLTLLDGMETNDGVKSMLPMGDTLVVGGSFDDFQDQTVRRIVLFKRCVEELCTADSVGSDFNPPGDGTVDGFDLAYLLGEWGPNPGSSADIVNSSFNPPPDGNVDGFDLAVLLGAWGTCP
jgi:hypothetical protein